MVRSRLWVRVASDVHLEFRENLNEHKWASLVPQGFSSEPDYSPDLDRSCLVLAGDVGHPSTAVYAEYLERCKANFDHLIVISGNHESYMQQVKVIPERCKSDPNYLPDPGVRSSHRGRVRISWTDAWARSVCERVGAVFLQKQTHRVLLPDGGGVSFAGCTLWSHIPKHMETEASYSLNDFHHALDELGKPFSVDAYNRKHREHVEWLSGLLASDRPPDVAVVHHLPSSKLVHEKYAHSNLNCCFASDSIPEPLFRRAKLWCAGHSHSFVDLSFPLVESKEDDPALRRETRAIVNPMGYPREETGYRPDWFFRLEGNAEEA